MAVTEQTQAKAGGARWSSISLALASVALLGLANWWYTGHIDTYLPEDFSNFWVGGHMLVVGQNPFSPGQWQAAIAAIGAYLASHAFQYPPWSAVLLIPLGILPFHLAITLFLVSTELSLVGIFWLSQRLLAWRDSPRGSLYLFACMVLLFRPTLVTFHNGQPSLLLLLVVFFGIWLISQRQDFWGGVALVLLAFKPQLEHRSGS